MATEFAIAVSLQLIDNFTRQLFQTKEALQNFNEQLQQTQSRIQKAFDPRSLQQFSEKLEDVTTRIAQATALPAATFAKAISAFSQMEQAKVEMEIAYMTKEGLLKEFEEINKQVEKLGTILPGSAEDFYRVATALKQAGMDTKTIVSGALETTAKAWVLFKREVSPEKAAEYMQTFANAFKVPAEEFQVFLDQLQRVAFASGLTLSEIAYSTKYISSELNQLGITGTKNFKLVGAWLGTLKQMGLQGETAGTSLRSALQNILNLEENLAKLRKSGIELQIDTKLFVDETGKFKLEEFLMTVRDELSKIQDPLKRMQALKTLFDAEGMRAIAPLLASTKEEALSYLEAIKETLSPEEFEAFRKQIEAGGFSGLEEMAKRMEEQASLQDRINKAMDTLSNIMESVQGTAMNLFATFGSLVAPTLKVVLEKVNNLIDGFNRFVENNRPIAQVLAILIGGFIVLAGAVGTVSLVIASFLKMTSLVLSPIHLLTTAILQKSASFALLKTALISTITALRALSVAMLTTPAGWVALALAGAALLIVKFWKPISGFFKGLWQGLKEGLSGLEPAWNVFKKFAIILYPVLAPLKLIYNAIKNLLKPIDDTGKAAENLGGRVGKAIANILSTILTLPAKMFEAGVKLVNSLWQGIKSVASKPVEEIRRIAQKIRNFLPFSPAKEGPLRDIHRIRLIETIAETIKPGPLLTSVKQALEPVKTLAQPLIQPVKQVLEPVKTLAQPLIQPVKLVLESPNAFAPAKPTIQNFFHFTIHGTITEKEKESIATELRQIIERTLQKINYERERRRY